MTIFRIAMSVMALSTAMGAAAGMVSAADGPLAAPSVPVAIAVPATARVVKKVHAIGAQIYVCGAGPGDAAKFAWTLKAPDAVLSDASGVAVGTHGAGPSWTAKDGSSVAGKKAAEAPAPATDAIPWLLVRAVSNGGQGIFAKVTFIQRVNTKGGKAPAAGCAAATAKAEKRVDYTADYYFFEGGNS